MPEEEPTKPAFLQCCLVCNVSVPATSGTKPPRSPDGSDLRCLLAAHVSAAARDELAVVEAVCAPCLATLQQWNGARLTARRLHQALAERYRAARQRRAACVLSLHLERLVVQLPYGAFLLNARGRTDGASWAELVRRVAAAVLESAGIARPEPPPPPPAGTRTVGCQTPADAEPAALPADSTEPEPLAQPKPAAARRPRGRRPRSAIHAARPAKQQPAPQTAPQPSQPAPQPSQQAPQPSQQAPQPSQPLLGCLRGWEGITNVQPSAPARPSAGAQKRVGFEGLKEQAARARDLEETLSILSVADTASLLDRTETLSVFSDTADLSTLADDNWTPLELAGGREPDVTMQSVQETRPESTPSVSFAEPSGDSRRHSARRSIDKGEDLLREFAETMSNISEGVVLEDLEGYFEEIDRPCQAGTVRPACGADLPAVAAADTGDTADTADTTTATASDASTAQCPVCHKVFRHRRYLRPHMRLHDGSLFHCERCDAPFLHHYKLQLHLRRRHGVSLRPGGAAGRPPAAQRRPAAAAAPAPAAAAAAQLACTQCGRRFSHATTLRQHERLHRGGGYPCDQCAKVFPSKSELSRHADTHRAEKLYKCSDCGRAFQVSSSLARHRTLHTERAARCDLCGKQFDRKDTMLKHRATHKASNKHACPLCGKMYKQRRILQKHLKLIHGGQAEHVCRICQKSFRTNYEMLAHTSRVHTPREPVAT